MMYVGGFEVLEFYILWGTLVYISSCMNVDTF